MESSPPADCPVGGDCRPILANSGLIRNGEVLAYDFGCLSYDFTFLSYVFPVLSYGLRFLSHECISPLALNIRKVHSNGKQSASDCPVGGGCRPILPNNGLTRIGELLSYDFYPLSYDFVFLSYVFRVLSYGFQLLSHERILLLLSSKRKVHSYGKQSARGLPSGRRLPPDLG